VAKAQLESAIDQVDVAKASVDSAQDALDKTTVVSPLDGTITKLNSQLGERVLGTVQNAGTDIMTISDLNEMEARVDIGEMDVVIIKPGQKVRLEVDSFKDRKFNGVVTDIANSSEGLDSGSYGSASYSSSSSSSSSQGATQFQVRIHVTEKEFFRPGMSVTAEIETRSSTNALAVPIACVTTRVVKEKSKFAGDDPPKTNSISSAGNTTNVAKADKKPGELQKPVEVVFVVNGDHVKTVPVKIGISDDNYWEVTDGLREGDEIVSGGYRAISRDLDDGKKIHKGAAGADTEKSP
jgi:HlyD family secretion protein